MVKLRSAIPWLALAAVTSTAACTSILGLKNASLRWCAQPGNEHDFCEDFDHENFIASWGTRPDPPPGATRTIIASDDSPPNALSTTIQPLTTGQANFTGLATAFTTRSIDHVIINVDVRVVRAEFKSDGAIVSGIGFLLLEDTSSVMTQRNTCMGLLLAPTANTTGTVAIAVVVVPNPMDCFTVNNLMLDGGDDAGTDTSMSGDVPAPIVLATIPTNQWQHVSLEIIRSEDGSGILRPTIANAGALSDVPVPAELYPAGYPQLGIASSVTGPAGNVEIDFDNVTADFP